MASKACLMLILAFTVALTAFLTPTSAQNSACTTAGTTLSSDCGQYFPTLLKQKNLAGASDAAIATAAKQVGVTPSAACCSALASLLKIEPNGGCACDSTVQTFAQSAYGVNGEELVSGLKAGADSCGSSVPYPAGLTCPAASGR